MNPNTIHNLETRQMRMLAAGDDVNMVARTRQGLGQRDGAIADPRGNRRVVRTIKCNSGVIGHGRLSHVYPVCPIGAEATATRRNTNSLQPVGTWASFSRTSVKPSASTKVTTSLVLAYS